MSNEEIIAILSDIIRNIATRHAYGMLLDWGKRATLFKASDKEGCSSAYIVSSLFPTGILFLSYWRNKNPIGFITGGKDTYYHQNDSKDLVM